MTRFLLLTIFLIVTALPLFSTAQCPTPGFTVQGQLCSGDTLQLINTSSNGIGYSWDFCPGYFTDSPQEVSDTTTTAGYPGDLTFAWQDDTLVGFLSAFNNQSIQRFEYGNGPGNAVTAITDLGNPGSLLYQPADMELFQEQGNWFGLIVDNSNMVVRVRFGDRLTNAPDSAMIVLPVSGSPLASPRSIRLVKETDGRILGVVSNYTSASITVLDFGYTIRNNPTFHQSYSVPGVVYVYDFQLVRSCDHWFGFAAGYTSGKVVVADFGNSMLNTPTFTELALAGQPSDLAIIQDNAAWKLLYTSFAGSELYRYNLGPDLSQPTPVLLGSELFGSLYPKGLNLQRAGDAWYCSILDIGNSRVRMLKNTKPCPSATVFSNDFEPSGIVFRGAGSYPITLTVTDANGFSAAISDTVEVFSRPEAGFTFTGNCFGQSTEFLDTTFANGGIISSWSWQFGTGDSSYAQNPLYTYPAAGAYPVSLTTVGTAGCTSTFSDTVVISPLPQVQFQTGNGCSETLIGFTDLSTVGAGSIIAWHWEFGNGDTSDLQFPQYAFPTGGNYTISLTVQTDAGCSSSSMNVLAVNDRPRGNFESSNTCVGQTVQFIDLTDISGATVTSWDWDFGDGQTSTNSNPSHVYAGGVADYTVRFVVVADNGCIDTVERVVRINNIPTPNFSFLPASACQGSQVNFSDLSAVAGDTIAGWRWDFGDGTTDTVRNPVHRFQQAGPNTVSLIAYAPSRCPSAIFQQVVNVVESPVADFIVDEACDGSETFFQDASSVPAGSTIQRYEWDFGDGDTAVSANASHLYTATGTFPVRLTVTSDFGCSSTDSMDIRVYPVPVAAFVTANPCQGQALQFRQTSSVDTPSVVSSFYWNFGDFGDPQNTSNLPNPTHIYDTTLTYDVYLIATTDFGCSDTTMQTVQINPAAPVNFTYTPTCFGELMEFFNPGSAQDSLFSWDFGDNQVNQVQEPAHYYAFPGTYTVTLTVTSFSGCLSSASRQVTVSPIPRPGFSTAPACVNTPYTFTDTSRISAGSITAWNWSLPDGTILTGNAPQFTFTDTGTVSVNLSVISDIGCEANISRNLVVNPLPVANFSFDPQFGNPPLEVNFNDLSVLGASYQWNFGDGGTSTQMNPVHTYNDTGLFVISEIVTSAGGCIGTVEKNIYVIRPILDLAVTGDSSFFDGTFFHIVARVANLGTRPIDNYRMEARIENGSTIRETCEELLTNGPSGIQWYNFRAAFLIGDGPEPQYYCIRAVSPNGETDDIPENNERCFQRTANILIANPYPNPFTGSATLDVLLPYSDQLVAELFDASGRLVQNLNSGKGSKGLNRLTINGANLLDGVYTARIRFRDQDLTRQVVKNSSTR